MIVTVAMIVFICVSMNHLGLIEAIERMIGLKIPVVNCCKCSTFWFTTTFLVCEYHDIGIITIIAIAFLVCIAAVWLELAMGILDTLYNRCYERIWNTTAVTENDGNKGDTQADHKDNTETALS